MKLRYKLNFILIAAAVGSSLAVSAVFLKLQKSAVEKAEQEKIQIIIEETRKIISEATLSRDPLMLMDYLSTPRRDRPQVIGCRASINGIWSNIGAPSSGKDTTGSFEEEIWGGNTGVALRFSKAHIEAQKAQALKHAVGNLKIALAVVSAASILAAFLLSWSLTRRIRSLASEVEKVSGGKLGAVAVVKGSDEISELGRKFNEMSQKLLEVEQMKRTFISSVTHELRSPLGAIESYVRMMLADGAGTASSGGTVNKASGSQNGAVPEALPRVPADSGALPGPRRVLADGAPSASGARPCPTDDRRVPAVGQVPQTPGALRPGGTSQRSPEERANLQRILENASRLSHFVTTLLDISKIERGKMDFLPRKTDPAALIRDTAAFFVPKAEESGLALVTDIAPGLPEIILDQDLTGHVMTNLISNSIKFTPKSGKITVASAMKVDGGEKFLRVEVRDTGVGIPKSDLARLFLPFEQVRNQMKAKGTGLGLALAKRIVEMHDGRIGVESEQGRGSIFWFELPYKRKATQAK
ncbi:MAG: HAMP domain-containing sensor histidine kinase [bacterium]